MAILICFVSSIWAKRKTNFPEEVLNFEYAQPEFNNENAFIIDIFALAPQPKDNFVINGSYNVKGTFEVFLHDPKENNWRKIGEIELEKFGSTQRLKTEEKQFLKYRYFAVAAKEKNDFKFLVESKNDDIYVNVSSEEPLTVGGKVLNKENTVIIYYKGLDVEDYIKIRNFSKKTDYSIELYVFSKDKQQWIPAGTAFLKGYGDTDTVEPICPNELSDYEYCALYTAENIPLRCEYNENHSDLIITILDDPLRISSKKEDENLENIDLQLLKVKDLFEKGLIDEEEYKLKKAQILGL